MGPRQRGVDAGDASEVNKMVKVKILKEDEESIKVLLTDCLLYTSPSPRDRSLSRMPSSA